MTASHCWSVFPNFYLTRLTLLNAYMSSVVLRSGDLTRPKHDEQRIRINDLVVFCLILLKNGLLASISMM